MMRRSGLPLRVTAAALASGIVVAGCASESASPAPGPSCADQRIAEASAYRYDPATAIAVSHGIAESHPGVKGIVDVVADHQRHAPDAERLVVTDRRAMPADVSFVYIMVLVNLAARPDLATPETISILRSAAVGPADDAEAEVRGRGMLGITQLMTDDQRVLEADDPGVAELSTLIYHQGRAVEDGGMQDILSTGCARDPGD